MKRKRRHENMRENIVRGDGEYPLIREQELVADDPRG